MNRVDTYGEIKPQAQDTTAKSGAIGSRYVTPSTETEHPQEATNSVSLSNTALEISSFETSLKGLPGVDLDRVEAIRAAINAGDYIVDADKLVRGLLSEEKIFEVVSGSS